RFVNHQPPKILEVIPFIESKEWIETKNELYKMMEAYTKRMNQQREQEALLAAQKEQELLEQEQAVKEKQELFRLLVRRLGRLGNGHSIKMLQLLLL
nr:hypothetical protein [Tanacetum cinerariifolium]